MRFVTLAAVAACSLVANTLFAQPSPVAGDRSAPLIPIETPFGAPTAVDAQLSPDGRWIAELVPWRNRLNIHVRSVSGRSRRRVTADSTRSIDAYWWSADGTRLLYLQDGGGDERYHLFVRNLSSAAVARDLTPFTGVEVEMVARPSRAPDVAVITLNRRDPHLADAYRVDLRTGVLTLAAENPGTFLGYAADRIGQVLVAYSVDSLGRYSLHARASEAALWRVVHTYAATDRITPLQLRDGGQQLFAMSNAGTDLLRLVLIDLQTGIEQVVGGDPDSEADLETAMIDANTDTVLVTTYVGDTARVYPAHPASARAMALARRRVPGGGLTVSSHSDDWAHWLIAQSTPDRGSRIWHTDLRTNRVQLIHVVRPDLDRRTLATMQPFRVTARDGMLLRGYITRPAVSRATPGPMVVLVHGGPWSRDLYEFQGDVQLLANRGYAVLQLNYRGSTGFGKRYAQAARHQFAGAMHTDLLDGVQWAVERGIADPARVAIMGGSYGGYAALVGLTFTPRAFRCAVDYAGISNLVTLLEAFPPSWQPFLPRTWYPMVGDPRDSTSRADLLKRSPIFRADSAIAPLLIFQGANDPRVTPVQSSAIAAALHRRRIPVTYLLASSEGHDFGEAETSLAVNRATEVFLAGCLGGRQQPTVAPMVTRRLKSLRVNLDSLVQHPR